MVDRIKFVGPDGSYVVSLDLSKQNLTDSNLTVDFGDSVSTWSVETDEKVDGGRQLSGFTSSPNIHWFVLKLGECCRIEYWGDRILMRLDEHAEA